MPSWRNLKCLIVASGAAAALFGGAGCHLPRSSASGRPPSDIAAAANPDQAEPANLAAVLAEVEQLGATDPAAKEQLLAELQQTSPEMWPLVVEQFRSTQAYREQLAARAASTLADAEPQPPADDVYQPPRDTAAALTMAAKEAALEAARPSTQLGALIDPRMVRRDPPASDAGAGRKLAVESPQTAAAAASRNTMLPAAQAATVARAGDDPATSSDTYAPAEFHPSDAPQPLASAGDEQRAMASDEGTGVVHASFNRASPTASGSTVVLAGVSPATESEPEARSRAAAGLDSHDWRGHLALAIAELGRQVAAEPRSTEEFHEHARLRLLRLVAGQPEAALEPIPHASPAEQDYWSRQVFALAALLDHEAQPDEKRRASASVAHLDEAVASLRELGTLTLRNLAFCKQVHDFGAYDPYDNNQFTAGQQVSLYVEVENFHSQSTEKGYCTSLGSTYELLDDEGKRFDGGDFPDVKDCCLSRRRDFHIQFGLTLPKTLPAGEYQLQLVVKDRRSDKRGQAVVAFEIGGAQR